MTTDATEILTLLAPDSPDTWPQGILATADLREQRAKAANPGPYTLERCGDYLDVDGRDGGWVARTDSENPVDAEHIAAEANPAHALAAVHHWRGVAGRHVPMDNRHRDCHWCGWHHIWPCPDLTETADDARAYLQGGA